MKKTIRAGVNEDGTRAFGVGFNSNRVDKGKYRVDFAPPFPDTPSFVATAIGQDAGGHRLLTLYDVSNTGFSLTTRKDTEKRDAAFNFYASNVYDEQRSDG